MKRPLVNNRVTVSGMTMASFATTMMLAMTLVVLEFPSNNMPMLVDAMSTTNKKPSLQSMTSPLTSPLTSSRSMSMPSVQMQKMITPPPRKTLTPPFPNGLCGGTVLDIAPEETFGVDVNLANINVLGDMVLLPRTIQIWLPPGYDDEDEVGHSVLYVHDGQNCMEDNDSWTGASWRLVGALTRLADHELICSQKKKTSPADLGVEENHPAALSPEEKLPIVVMLPSAEGDWLPGVRRRHLEYGDMNLPFAQAHADFVANTVKPLVDNRFRTDPSPEHTFCMGSSLGGQASLHLLLRHPDKFGGAACLSPAFGPAILDCVDSPKGRDILKGNEKGKKKLYFDIGGDMDDSKTSDFVRVSPIDVLDHLTPVHGWNPGYFWLDTQLQGQVAAMKKALDKARIEYEYRQYPGGRHNERAWALRIDKPLLHLFSNDSNKKQQQKP